MIIVFDAIDVTREIDNRPVGSLLVQVVVLCSMVAFLDGLDTTSIGVAAPLIADQMKLSPAQLGPLFSAALFGAMLGALGFGPLADRFGRKRMLLAATLMFGMFTIATSLAGSLRGLLLIRFLAGIGLGGAPPCFIALASEYAPKARRALVTSLVWTAFPMGIILGSFLNGYLISLFSWQAIFRVGGVAPLIVLMALLIWLPESVRYLILTEGNPVAISRVVKRIIPHVPAGARFISTEMVLVGAPVRNLFSKGRASQTVLLWAAFLLVFGSSTVVISFAPTLMRGHGIPLAQAAVVLGVASIGSVVGALGTGWLIGRLGAPAVLMPALVAGGLNIAIMMYAATSLPAIAAGLAIAALFVGGVGSTGLLAVAAGRYPTAMRSTGVGWAMGLGRFGQVLMPLFAGLLIQQGRDLGGVFLLLGLLPVAAAAAILLLHLINLRASPTFVPVD